MMRYDQSALDAIDAAIEAELSAMTRDTKLSSEPTPPTSAEDSLRSLAENPDPMKIIQACYNYLKSHPELTKKSLHEVAQPFYPAIQKSTDFTPEEMANGAPDFSHDTIEMLAKLLLDKAEIITDRDTIYEQIFSSIPNLEQKISLRLPILILSGCVDIVINARKTIRQYQAQSHETKPDTNQPAPNVPELLPEDIQTIVNLFRSYITPFEQIKPEIITPTLQWRAQLPEAEQQAIAQHSKTLPLCRLKCLMQTRAELVKSARLSDTAFCQQYLAKEPLQQGVKFPNRAQLSKINQQLTDALADADKLMAAYSKESPEVSASELRDIMQALPHTVSALNQAYEAGIGTSKAFEVRRKIFEKSQALFEPKLKSLEAQLAAISLKALANPPELTNISSQLPMDYQCTGLEIVLKTSHAQNHIINIAGLLQKLENAVKPVLKNKPSL